VQVGEGAGADEEDVAGVHLHEVVLVPVLGDVEGYEDLASLEQLEQGLLHALATDVRLPAPVRDEPPRRAILSISSMKDDPALGRVDGVAAL